MSIRDEFERWFLTKGGHSEDLAPDGQGGYREYETDLYWEGWEASRKLLLIELPACRAIRFTPMADENGSYNEAIDACRDALTDVGLTVKP